MEKEKPKAIPIPGWGAAPVSDPLDLPGSADVSPRVEKSDQTIDDAIAEASAREVEVIEKLEVKGETPSDPEGTARGD